ncbi:hypothetical protein IAQ61_002228 [Plenodomus lingam]|uniref:uncharacterized protein n=1 Tax=Leptosphaeria maculans TaxID=5022 RepID=UPI0033202814|nr:hypothetical protein IAQ61_002228 [Plenodomus lingam]
MSPPRRALFSLNLDTDADHVHQRISHHNKDGEDRVRVIETKGPTHSHTDLSYVTKPFEKAVNRAVNEVVDGTGKKVHTAEGQISYSSSSTERRRDGNSRLNIISKSKRRALENKYDTSEL